MPTTSLRGDLDRCLLLTLSSTVSTRVSTCSSPSPAPIALGLAPSTQLTEHLLSSRCRLRMASQERYPREVRRRVRPPPSPLPSSPTDSLLYSIMSAIDFEAHVEKVHLRGADRVKSESPTSSPLNEDRTDGTMCVSDFHWKVLALQQVVDPVEDCFVDEMKRKYIKRTTRATHLLHTLCSLLPALLSPHRYTLETRRQRQTMRLQIHTSNASQLSTLEPPPDPPSLVPTRHDTLPRVSEVLKVSPSPCLLPLQQPAQKRTETSSNGSESSVRVMSTRSHGGRSRNIEECSLEESTMSERRDTKKSRTYRRVSCDVDDYQIV